VVEPVPETPGVDDVVVEPDVPGWVVVDDAVAGDVVVGDGCLADVVLVEPPVRPANVVDVGGRTVVVDGGAVVVVVVAADCGSVKVPLGPEQLPFVSQVMAAELGG